MNLLEVLVPPSLIIWHKSRNVKPIDTWAGHPYLYVIYRCGHRLVCRPIAKRVLGSAILLAY